MAFQICVSPINGWKKWNQEKLDVWYEKNPPICMDIGTNKALVNFWSNLEMALPGFEKNFPMVSKLFEKEFLLSFEVPAFVKQWNQIADALSGHGIDEIVIVTSNYDAQDGTVLRKEVSGAVLVRPTKQKIDEFIDDNDSWARGENHPNFTTSSLRDAFWYQIERTLQIAEQATDLKRGIHLE